MRSALPLGFMVLSLLWTQPSNAEELHQGDAEPRTSSLSWVRLPNAESCIGTRALAEAVEERLHRPVIVSAAQADLSIEGRIERISAQVELWRATVVVSDSAGEVLGERTIESDEPLCGAIEEPLVLVIAVMIDPEAALRPREPTAEPSPQPEPVDVAEPVDVEPSETDSTNDARDPNGARLEEVREEPSRTRTDIAASFLAGLGTHPVVSLGPRLSVIIDLPRFWPLEVTVDGLFGAEVDAVGGAHYELTLLRGGLAICAPFDRPHVSIHGCLGVSAGAIRSTGAGFDTSFERWSAQVDGVGKVRLIWNPAGLFTLHIGAALVVPFLTQRILYRDGQGTEQVLFESWPVGAVFEGGLGLRF